MNFRFVLFSVVYSSASERTFVRKYTQSDHHHQNNDFNVFLLVLFSVVFTSSSERFDESFGSTRAISDISFLFCFLFVCPLNN